MIHSSIFNWIRRPLTIAVLLLLSDLMTSYTFLTEWGLNKNSEKVVLMVFERQNLDPMAISDYEWEEFGRVIQQTLGTVLFIFILFNSVTYFLFYQQKPWAIKYVKSYCYAGFFLSFLFIFQSQNLPGFVQFLNLLATFIYGCISLNFYLQKKSENLAQ